VVLVVAMLGIPPFAWYTLKLSIGSAGATGQLWSSPPAQRHCVLSGLALFSLKGRGWRACIFCKAGVSCHDKSGRLGNQAIGDEGAFHVSHTQRIPRVQ
jgi:hypothetical protein